MKTDTRQDWEIVWRIDMQIAADYLRMTKGTRRCLGIHNPVTRANAVIDRANRLVAQHGPLGSAALSAAEDSLAVLRDGASGGLVPIAGIAKTEMATL